MDYVLIIHSVRDYEVWKRAFDDAASIRGSAGERRYHVLRDAKDPNRVIHFSQWSSIVDATAFFESPEVVAIRRQAGVEAPQFNYLRSLEQGSL